MSRGLTLFFALILGACSTVPPKPERSADELESLWQQHQHEVAKITAWSLTGRISVTTEDDGWSGELRWSQSPENFQIHFTAPFGQGAFKMKGDDNSVVLRFSDGQVYRAQDAESLLLAHVGWRLPLSEFRYWITGLPGTQNESGKSFNNNGQLAELHQGQWRIRYPEYFAVGEMMMPRKVYFNNHGLSVRLVIDQWQINSGGTIYKQVYDDSF